MTDPPYITPAQLAARTGQTGTPVKVRWIRRLCQQGKLRCIKPGGRDWLIERQSAEAWLERRAFAAAVKRGDVGE